MRIVRLANFVTSRSGGLRTALRELGAGYRTAGHEPVLVVPGAADRDEDTEQGRVITLSGPEVPGLGGYRVLLNRRRVERLLDALAPERLEVSDRTTLRWVGEWGCRQGVPAVMVAHESPLGLMRLVTGGRVPVDWFVDRLNARTAASFDRVVCTTSWASAEFRRVGATNLAQVPLGVDLRHFHPSRYDSRLRTEYAGRDELLLLHCGRLSVEKGADRPVAALAELRAWGHNAVLVMVGSGPHEARLRAHAIAARLPVHFEDHIADRERIAALFATADVVIAPGPVETFGLAALEALASGTPVVVSAESALPEVAGDAGRAAVGGGRAYAEAVLDLAARPAVERRAAARRRAERYPWSASVAGFLAVHGVSAAGPVAVPD